MASSISQSQLDDASAAPKFVISRTFNAPRSLVWSAFTQGERLAHWWGPKGFKVKVSDMDLRPGGTYHYCLVSPDGLVMWGKFVFREIAPQERLVFVSSFSDEMKGITRHPFNPSWPAEMLSVFEFEDAGKGTKVTINWVPLTTSESEIQTFKDGMNSMHNGWTGTFDQLEAYLATA